MVILNKESGLSVRTKMNRVITRVVDIRDFGATQGADCSSAVADAIASAVSEGARGVYFPPGEWTITAPGAMSLPASTNVNGFAYVGAGLGATVINYTPTVQGYLIENDDDHLRVGFRGMRINGNGANARFYYLTSSGTAQSIRFFDMMWYNVGQIMRITGATNASETLWHACKMLGVQETVFECDNDQSVNHQFFGTDIEVCKKGVFYFREGGNLNVFGGSLILDGAEADNKLIDLDDTSGSGIGLNNWEYNFYGVRTEIKDSSTLLKNNSGGTITFRDCNLYVVGTTTREIARINGKGRVRIDGGTINSKWYLAGDNSSTWADTLRQATLEIRGAHLRQDFSFEIQDFTNKGGKGRVTIEGCRQSQGATSTTVLDADHGWQNGNSGIAIRKKSAIMRVPNRSGGLPTPSISVTLNIPPDAELISAKMVHRSQSGATGQVYTLELDATEIASWTFNAGSDVFTEVALNHLTGSTLVLAGDAENADTSYNGFVIVEYI